MAALTVYLNIVPASVNDLASWTLWWYGAVASARPCMRKNVSLSIFLAFCVASASTYALKFSFGNPIIRSVNAESKGERGMNERSLNEKRRVEGAGIHQIKILSLCEACSTSCLECTHYNKANRWWATLPFRTWRLFCWSRVSWQPHSPRSPSPTRRRASHRDFLSCSTGTCI